MEKPMKQQKQYTLVNQILHLLIFELIMEIQKFQILIKQHVNNELILLIEQKP